MYIHIHPFNVVTNRDACVHMYVTYNMHVCTYVNACMHAHELELESLLLFTVMGLVSVC